MPIDIGSYAKNLSMILWERNTSIVFSSHSLSLKKLIFSDREKGYTQLDWWLMFSNLRKLKKNLYEQKKKKKSNSFCFISVRVQAVLRFLDITNIWQYKKLPWEKFLKKKKRTFRKILCCMQKSLEPQNLDGEVHFLELSIYINAFLS